MTSVSEGSAQGVGGALDHGQGRADLFGRAAGDGEREHAPGEPVTHGAQALSSASRRSTTKMAITARMTMPMKRW